MVYWPCFDGIVTDTQDQLISANLTIEEQRRWIGADSLAYISLPGLYEAVSADHPGFCDACFSGEYAVDIPEAMRRRSFLGVGEVSEKWRAELDKLKA